jgi:hypothetical protein
VSATVLSRLLYAQLFYCQAIAQFLPSSKKSDAARS